MSAALVRWGATAGPQRSGRSEDGAGERQSAPGPADGPFAAGAAAATLLARGAGADSPMAAALRAAEKGQVERERWQAEAKRRRAIAAAEAEAGAAPSEPAQSSPATPSRQPHGIGLGAALDLPVMPNSSGSSLPPSVTDLPMTHSPRVKAESDAARMRAEHEYNNKLREAIRDDELGLYTGPDRFSHVYNDLRFGRLGPFGIFTNEIKRAGHRRDASEGIGRMKSASAVDAELERVRKKHDRGEGLSPGEWHMLENASLVPLVTNREKDRGFETLVAAMAGLERAPQSPGLRKLREANNAGEYIDVLVDHPLEIFFAKAGEEFPTNAASYGGKLLGGPIGGILAAVYVTFGQTFADEVLEGFAREGIDLQNRDSVLKAVENKDLMRKIYDNASKRAGIAASTAIISGFVASKQLTSVPSRFGGRIVEGAAQAGVQAGIGATGQFAADRVTGEKPIAGNVIDAGVSGALSSLVP